MQLDATACLGKARQIVKPNSDTGKWGGAARSWRYHWLRARETRTHMSTLAVPVLGLRAEGLEFGVRGSGFRVWNLGGGVTTGHLEELLGVVVVARGRDMRRPISCLLFCHVHENLEPDAVYVFFKTGDVTQSHPRRTVHSAWMRRLYPWSRPLKPGRRRLHNPDGVMEILVL